MPLPEGPGFSVELEDPSYWTPVLVRGRDAGGVVLRLHPVTDVRVEVKPPGGSEPPGEVRVGFSTTPTAAFPPGTAEARQRLRKVVQGEVPCRPTGEAAVWSCPVPSGRMDLRLQVAGFASDYRWGIPLGPFGETTLPPLDLVAGGSLVGWLETPSGELPEGALAPEATVELLPAGEPTGQTGVGRLAHSAAVSERGFFQFRDVPEGLYRLHVALPEWARAEVGPLEVLAGLETRLVDPVRLQEPGRLAVCVEPPVPPGIRRPGDTWTVRLEPPDRRSPASWETVDALGCVRLHDLQPGTYDFTLGDERRSRWEGRKVEVRSGEQRLDVRVRLFPIEGTLQRDSEPVRARLTFRRLVTGEDGSRETREVGWFVDPEGRFEGALPEPGRWYVQAKLRRDGAVVDLDVVEIADRPGRVQELSLEVPETRLAGKVLDAEGRPVRSAEVWLHRDAAPPADRPPAANGTVTTDDSGRYAFEGIPPGDYDMTAYRGHAWASAEVQVVEDVEVPGPTLVLEATREVDVFVVGDRGGIPRAQVFAIPEPRDVPFRGTGARTTDAQGQVRLTVPETATSLRILVAAVGHGTRILQVPLADDPGPLVLSMDRLAGTLRLTREGEETLPGGVVLLRDGVPMSLGLVAMVARSLGGTTAPYDWTIPSMAPGPYRVCDRTLEHCSAGFLGVGQTLELEVGG